MALGLTRSAHVVAVSAFAMATLAHPAAATIEAEGADGITISICTAQGTRLITLPVGGEGDQDQPSPNHTPVPACHGWMHDGRKNGLKGNK